MPHLAIFLIAVVVGGMIAWAMGRPKVEPPVAPEKTIEEVAKERLAEKEPVVPPPDEPIPEPVPEPEPIPPPIPIPEPVPVEPVTIDRLEVRCDFAANVVYARVTITNNTGKTLLHQPRELETKLFVNAYRPNPAWLTDIDLGPVIKHYGSISPGTHTFSGQYPAKLTANKVVEGVGGIANVRFQSTGPGPKPVVWYINIGTLFNPISFGGKFSSSWQKWERVAAWRPRRISI